MRICPKCLLKRNVLKAFICPLILLMILSPIVLYAQLPDGNVDLKIESSGTEHYNIIAGNRSGFVDGITPMVVNNSNIVRYAQFRTESNQNVIIYFNSDDSPLNLDEEEDPGNMFYLPGDGTVRFTMLANTEYYLAANLYKPSIGYSYMFLRIQKVENGFYIDLGLFRIDVDDEGQAFFKTIWGIDPLDVRPGICQEGHREKTIWKTLGIPGDDSTYTDVGPTLAKGGSFPDPVTRNITVASSQNLPQDKLGYIELSKNDLYDLETGPFDVFRFTNSTASLRVEHLRNIPDDENMIVDSMRLYVLDGAVPDGSGTYFTFPIGAVIYGKRDTLSQAAFLDWSFSLNGLSGRVFSGRDTVHFWGDENPSAEYDTNFSREILFNKVNASIPLDIDSVAGGGDWELSVYLTDSIFSAVRSIPDTMTYSQYLRRRPELSTIVAPTQPAGDTSGWSFGTPKYVKLDWTPHVNTGTMMGSVTDSIEGPAGYFFNWIVKDSSNGIVDSGSGLLETKIKDSLIQPNNTERIGDSVSFIGDIHETNLAKFLEPGTYKLFGRIKSDGCGNFSDTIEGFQFIRADYKPAISGIAIIDSTGPDLNFKITLGYGGDTRIDGKSIPIIVGIVTDTNDLTSLANPGLETACTLAYDSQDFEGLSVPFNPNDYSHGQDLFLVVQTNSSGTDHIQLVRKIQIFKNNIGVEPGNITVTLFQGSGNVFPESANVTINGYGGYCTFAVQWTQANDSSKKISAGTYTVASDTSKTIHWNGAGIFDSVTGPPLNGNYKLTVTANIKEKDIVQKSGDFEFSWADPVISGVNFGNQGAIDTSGNLWFGSTPNAVKAKITGPTIYNGLNIWVYSVLSLNGLQPNNLGNPVLTIPKSDAASQTERNIALDTTGVKNGPYTVWLKAAISPGGADSSITFTSQGIRIDTSKIPDFNIIGQAICSTGSQHFKILHALAAGNAPILRYGYVVTNWNNQTVITLQNIGLDTAFNTSLPQSRLISWAPGPNDTNNSYTLDVQTQNILNIPSRLQERSFKFKVDLDAPLVDYSVNTNVAAFTGSNEWNSTRNVQRYKVYLKVDSLRDVSRSVFSIKKTDSSNEESIDDSALFSDTGYGLEYTITDVDTDGNAVLTSYAKDMAGHKRTTLHTLTLDFTEPSMAACTLSHDGSAMTLHWNGNIASDAITTNPSDILVRVYIKETGNGIETRDSLPDYTGNKQNIITHALDNIGSETDSGSVYEIFIHAIDQAGNRKAQGFKINSNGTIDGIAIKNFFYFGNWILSGEIAPDKVGPPANVQIEFNSQCNALGIPSRTMAVPESSFNWIDGQNGSKIITTVDLSDSFLSNVRYNSVPNQVPLKLKGLRLSKVHDKTMMIDTITADAGSYHFKYANVPLYGAVQLGGLQAIDMKGRTSPITSASFSGWTLQAIRDTLTENGIIVSGNLSAFHDSLNSPLVAKRMHLTYSGVNLGIENGVVNPFAVKPDSTAYNVRHAHLDHQNHEIDIDSAYVVFYDGVVPDRSPYGGEGIYSLKAGDLALTNTNQLNTSSSWWTEIISPLSGTGGVTQAKAAFPISIGENEIIAGDLIEFTSDGKGNLLFQTPVYQNGDNPVTQLSGTHKVTSYGIKASIELLNVEYPIGKYGFARIKAGKGIKDLSSGSKITLKENVQLKWSIPNVSGLTGKTTNLDLDSLDIFPVNDVLSDSVSDSVIARYSFDPSRIVRTNFADPVYGIISSWMENASGNMQLYDFTLKDDRIVIDSICFDLPYMKDNAKVCGKNIEIIPEWENKKPGLKLKGRISLDSGTVWLDAAKYGYGLKLHWGGCEINLGDNTQITFPNGASAALYGDFPKLDFSGKGEAFIDSAGTSLDTAAFAINSILITARGLSDFYYETKPLCAKFFNNNLALSGKMFFKVDAGAQAMDAGLKNVTVRVDSFPDIPSLSGRAITLNALNLTGMNPSTFTSKIGLNASDTIGLFAYSIDTAVFSYVDDKFTIAGKNFNFSLTDSFPVNALKGATANFNNLSFNISTGKLDYSDISIDLPNGKVVYTLPYIDGLQDTLTSIKASRDSIGFSGSLVFTQDFAFESLRNTEVKNFNIMIDMGSGAPRLKRADANIHRGERKIELAGLVTIGYKDIIVSYNGDIPNPISRWSFSLGSGITAQLTNNIEIDGLKGRCLTVHAFTLTSGGDVDVMDIGTPLTPFDFYGFDCHGIGNNMEVSIGRDTSGKYYGVLSNVTIHTPYNLPWFGDRNVTIETFKINEDGIVSEFNATTKFSDIPMPFDLNVDTIGVGLAKKGLTAAKENFKVYLFDGSIKTPDLGSTFSPENFNLSGSTLRIDTVAVNFGGVIERTKFSGSIDSIRLGWSGFGVKFEDVRLDKDGVYARTGQLTLPKDISANWLTTSLQLADFHVAKSGVSFIPGITKFEVPLFQGARLVFEDIAFDFKNPALTCHKATAILPDILKGGRVELNDIRLDNDDPYFHVASGGARVELDAKDLHVPIDVIGLGNLKLFMGYTSALGFYYGGEASAVLPGLEGELGAVVEVAEKLDTMPLPFLKKTCMTFKASGLGIPVGATGVYLNGITGCYEQGDWDGTVPVEYAEYCFRSAAMDGRRLQLRLYFTAGGGIAEGEVGFWVNVEKIDIVEFGKLVILGWVEGNECVGVAKNFSDFRGHVKIGIDKWGVEIWGEAWVHLWEAANRAKFTVKAELGAALKKGAAGKVFGVAVPPFSLGPVIVGAEAGDFANNKKGFMLYYDFPVVGEYGVLMQSGIDLVDPGDYPLAE